MTDRFMTSGRVEAGTVKVRNLPKLRALAHDQRDGELLIILERAHAIRSHDQNALYWAAFVQPIAEYTGYTPKEIHAYLKHRFLPPQHIEIVDQRTGAVLDDADLASLTTTTLTREEFSAFLHDIGAWAADALNIVCGSMPHEVA